MKPSPSASFDEQRVLNELKHFLPAQAPLKDFIHHNTLHAFQHEPFHEAVKKASVVFGYSVFLPLSEYRNLYATGRIRKEILEKLIIERKGEENRNVWLKKIVHASFTQQESPRIGRLRANWKTRYHIDIDTQVHPIFLRILCNYLDQGISIWNFPTTQKSFLDSLRELEQNSFVSIFRTKKARELLFNKKCNLKDLLQIIVGDESLFEQYLFDQQFTHQGWSGMVATIESQPESLIDRKPISLQELIHFELLLEIDTLQAELGPDWAPLVKKMNSIPEALFAETTASDLQEILAIWQDAFEWSYYDHVLAGIQLHKHSDTVEKEKTFQAVFCIDDRECSLRRYLEKLDPLSETYSTPGFFGVEFFYQPDHGKHYTKL